MDRPDPIQEFFGPAAQFEMGRWAQRHTAGDSAGRLLFFVVLFLLVFVFGR